MAVSDDHSNSLIVSAPEDIMDTVAKVVESVDKSVEEDTEVRVFPLHNADPTEMAELLGNLFPDENGSSDASRSPIQFGGFGGRFLGGLGGLNGGARGNAASQGGDTSDRMKKLGRVVAVADRRTASLVVSTSKELMPQIEAMISKLDDNPARKQKVRVYTLKNADVADVQQVLSDLFPSGSGTSANRNNANQASSNPLLNRLNTTLQQQQSSSQGTGFGSSSFGGNTTGRGF
jgi:type II secretory pathway component GspD/PulD (secretin)